MNGIRQLIREVHRRSVWQVLAIYLVGSWIGYEVILALTEGVGLPDWVPPFAIALFIIGLPIVVATAFVQEGLPGESAAEASPAAESKPGGSAAEPAPTDSGATDASRSVLTWPRAISAGVLAFALLGLAATGFLGMRALGIGPVGTLVAKGELEAREPLVVADFTPLSGDTSLASVVSEGLRADLAQSTFVSAADRSKVRATLERMLRDPDGRLDPGAAREVAQRLGLKGVVEGEVGRAGAGYLLTARVVTADSGRTLTTLRETAADSTEILAAIEGLSRGLRERVGESLREVRASSPLARVTTASLPALRLAVEGSRLERIGRRVQGRDLIHEALELDPGFAWAWNQLTVMHYNDGDLALALDAADQALAHGDRLSDYDRYKVRSLRASITGDLATARREDERWIARDPTASGPRISASDVAWNQGDWDAAAAHAEQAIELGADDNWVAHWNRIVALVDGGRLEAAGRAASEADSMLPPENDIHVVQFRIMVLANDGARYDSAHAVSTAPDDQAVWRLSAIDRLRGRWDEAREHLRTAPSVPESAADLFERWDRFVVTGDPAAGDSIVAYFEAESAGPDTVSGRYDAQLALALAMDGRTDDARRVRDYYLAGVPEAVRWKDAHLLRAVDGFIALREGRVEDGLKALRNARARTPWTAPIDAVLGRAYDALGRPDSAIAAYTRYVETPWSYRLWEELLGDVVLLVPAHLRLALLHEERGDLEAAARHAAEVVRLWDGADPPLQGRVAAVRELLARSTAER
ncbi:MAG: tetratricopeptide repeat protein [Candidatus Longimicrobiales bacterium M2_2A_002]